MKKALESIMLIAAAAVAFSGCNKEIEQPVQEVRSTHTVTFSAVLDNSTKTLMTEGADAATFEWSDEDMDNFSVYENGEIALESIALIDSDVLSLTCEFEDGATAPFTYTATLNGAVGNQTLLDGKYDETSDVLVAKPVVSESVAETDFVFQFKRVVALNKMTIKGLGDDEIVSKVVVKCDKDLAGMYDLANDCWIPAETDAIVLDGGEEEGVLIDGGNAVVYFNCLPVEDGQFTIDVTTDKGEYTKTFSKTISLFEGMLNRFGVTVEKKETSEDIVIEMDDVEAVNYKVTFEKDGVTAVFDKLTGGTTPVWIANSEELRLYAKGSLTVSAPEGYVIKKIVYDYVVNKNSKGKYPTPVVTPATFDESTMTWTGSAFEVELFADGDAGNLGFKSLTVTIGPAVDVAVTSVELDADELDFYVGNKATLKAFIYPEDATNQDVTWSSDNESVATVDENGVVTAVSVGSANITVTTVDGGFTATCAATVKGTPEFESLEDLLEVEPDEDGFPVTVTLTDVEIESIYVNGQGYRNGVYLVAEGHTVEIYSRDVPESWIAGGTISGTLTDCTWKKYNSTWELCPDDWSDLSYTAPAAYNIIIATGIQHGSVEANVYSATKRTEITLTATPDTDYELDSYTVTDGDGAEIEVIDGKFIMPASDVNVSATFKQKPTDQKTVTFGTDWNTLFGTSYSGSISSVKANSLHLQGSDNGASIDVVNGTSTNGYIKTGDFRLYIGYTMTISVPSGKSITKITAAKGGKAISGITADTGNLSIPSGGATMEWTGSANSVVFSVSATMGFSSIVVTYN